MRWTTPRIVLAALAGAYAVSAAIATVLVFWVYDQAGDQ
jgi:hypothetical protein